MSEQNVCPHCGQSRIFYVGGGVYGCGPGRTAVCAACNARGQQRLTDDLALEAFTHPAHLHEYDPETQVVISREAAEQMAEYLAGECFEKNVQLDWGYRVRDELRAALEVKP